MGISKEEKKLLEIQAGQAYKHEEETKKSDRKFWNFSHSVDDLVHGIFK